MRLAWFSPLPPVRSGIATYSAELLPRLGPEFDVDCYVDRGAFDAHDFVWKQQRAPYDLVVYHVGNAPCHDYIWAYLARYPGLVVLHDARLHHARAHRLLNQKRFDDYRREFWYDHPDATADVVEYAVEGLGGSINYFWPMLRVVMRTARAVAVHNGRVAGELGDEYRDVPIDVIRMGVASLDGARDGSLNGDVGARARLRRELALPDDGVVFAAFGKITAEKRVGPMLRALAALTAEGINAFLLLVGDAADYPTLASEIQQYGIGDRVRVAGYVGDERVSAYLAAADVCLCLRWPTALETSASWLRCLAAARATVITDLAHLADIPTIDSSLRRAGPDKAGHDAVSRPSGPAPIAIRIDLLDEEESLRRAMRRLAADARLRDDLAQAGHAYWSREHTLDAMAEDYRRVMKAAAARPAPATAGLPAHFTDDYAELARRIARQFGVDVDILR